MFSDGTVVGGQAVNTATVNTQQTQEVDLTTLNNTTWYVTASLTLFDQSFV